MAKVSLTVQHAATGKHFRASGKNKPDFYIFTRVDGAHHLHRAMYPLAEWKQIQADLGLRLRDADIPVTIDIELEKCDLDHVSAKVVEELSSAKERVAELTVLLEKKLAETELDPAPEIQAKASEEQLAMLSERDEMLEVLTPFAQGDDTPIEVLKKIVKGMKPAKKSKQAKA